MLMRGIITTHFCKFLKVQENNKDTINFFRIQELVQLSELLGVEAQELSELRSEGVIV